MGEFDGKVAMVTGGNSGIGAATVHRLAREGAAVLLIARRHNEGQAIEQTVRARGGEATFHAADVIQRPAVEAAVAQTIERYGSLHIVVNNAGGAAGRHYIDQPDDDSWDRTLRLNLTSAYLMPQIAWPWLVAAGGGSVVNVSSVAAVWALPAATQSLIPSLLPPPAYWAAKAGLEALTRYLASAGAVHGIHCNAVRPGQILTPLVTSPRNPDHHAHEPLYDVTQLLPGPGQAVDVANALYYLASD